jgi:hypothetical protein
MCVVRRVLPEYLLVRPFCVPMVNAQAKMNSWFLKGGGKGGREGGREGGRVRGKDR